MQAAGTSHIVHSARAGMLGLDFIAKSCTQSQPKQNSATPQPHLWSPQADFCPPGTKLCATCTNESKLGVMTPKEEL